MWTEITNPCRQGCQMTILIKSQTVLKRPEKGQNDCLKARKRPNCICGITMLLPQKTFKSQEYQKSYLKLRLSLAWHCTGAHY